MPQGGTEVWIEVYAAMPEAAKVLRSPGLRNCFELGVPNRNDDQLASDRVTDEVRTRTTGNTRRPERIRLATDAGEYAQQN